MTAYKPHEATNEHYTKVLLAAQRIVRWVKLNGSAYVSKRDYWALKEAANLLAQRKVLKASKPQRFTHRITYCEGPKWEQEHKKYL